MTLENNRLNVSCSGFAVVNKNQLKAANIAVAPAMVRNDRQRFRWFGCQTQQKERGLMRKVFALIADKRAKML